MFIDSCAYKQNEMTTRQQELKKHAIFEINSLNIQCESKKIPPLRFSEFFSQTVGNF